jgi:recombinational DNA repair protein (RecF pathway)
VPKRYTPEEAKQLLLERGFSPLEPYHGAKERWKAKHLDCGGTVFITLNSIRNPRTKLGSCANCASNAATSEVDAVKIMKKAGLRPLVKFPGYDNPWKSTHVKCGRTVSPRLHSIKAGGNGCRKCGFKQSAIKRTTKNDIAIAELNSAGFEPLEQFRGVRIGWKSRCLTCKKVSSPQLGSIRAGRGCQHCANNVRLEHDEAVVRMKKFGVTPLVPYKNAVTPWKSRCMTCGKIVSPKLNSVQSGQGACKYCSKVYVDPKEAIKLMIQRGIEPKEPYTNSITPWKCKCMKCGRIVYPQYSSIKLGRGGCRYCAPTYVSPAEAVRIMKKAGYLPLEPYVNSKTHWRSTHKLCGRTVSPAFGNIASGTGGCKWCGVSGLDYSAPSYLYIVSHQEFGSLKVGISNDEARANRIAAHKRNGWKLHKTYKFKTGADASDCETAILRHLRIKLQLGVHLSGNLMPQGGHTETVDGEEITVLELTRLVDSFVRKTKKR